MDQRFWFSAACLTFCMFSCLSACTLKREYPSEPEAIPNSAEAILSGTEAFTGAGHDTPDVALSKLDAAWPASSEQERRIIDKLRILLAKINGDRWSLSATDYLELTKILSATAQIKPRDFSLQLRIASTIDAIEPLAAARPNSSIESAPRLSQNAANAAVMRAKNLRDAFPDEARAHAFFGRTLATSGQDDVGAIRSFGRCLELDPRNAACKVTLLALADEFQRPRCFAFKSGSISTYPAYVSPKGRGHLSLRKVKFRGQDFYLEKAPLLTEKDVEVGSESPGRLDGPNLLRFKLRRSALERLEGESAALVAKRGDLATFLGQDLMQVTPVMSAVSQGLVIRTAGSKLKDLCLKLEQPPLPQEVERLIARFKH